MSTDDGAAVDTAADASVTPDRIRDELRAVVDPCTAANGSNLDIVEMGLVESVTVDGSEARVEMHLTTPACHMVPYFITEITDCVEPLAGVESVTVDTDAGMEWTPEMMTDAARAKRDATLERYEARYSGGRATE
jgi:metal-sulfur cluster biosynthetic enzyme